jgi:hypothetical protein
VKGQIKLQCKTVTGKPFVVVRSFQLTRKSGGKYEFKALDQTISTINEHGDVRSAHATAPPPAACRARAPAPDAARCLCACVRVRVRVRVRVQREALSKRCADINLEVPSLMGVSKARTR